MKRKKLLKTLAGLLDEEARRKRRHQAELRELLDKLQDKETQLQANLRTETSQHRQEHLGKQLEIVRAQHAKGLEALQDLDKS